MFRLPAAIVVAALLTGSVLSAQELLFDFSQDRDTYTWSDSLVWQPEFAGGRRLLFSNASNATLVKESLLLDRKDRWQESYRSRLEWCFRDKSKFNITGLLVNDYRSFEERIVVDNRAGLATVYKPTERLMVSNIGSFLMHTRSNYGIQYQAEGYEHQLEARYDYQVSRASSLAVGFDQDLKLMPDISASGSRGLLSFSGLGSKDSIRAAIDGAYQQNKYFTTARSVSLISLQRKSTADATLLLSWRPARQSYLRLASNLDYRQYRYEHYGLDNADVSSGLLGLDNSSLQIDYELSARRRVSSRLTFDVQYLFRETDEVYGSLSAEQRVRTGELRCAVRSSPGILDSVWAEAIFSVTGYFSDEISTFFSDRDRIMRLYALGFMHRLSRCLTLRIDGSYRGYHQTYVSGSLSANNNHNVIYVASPEVVWQPWPWFEISNSFLLHANYTWYDYEKKMDAERNTLFRRARWQSHYRIVVSRRLSIRPSYVYKYEDFGQLFWSDQWVQRTNWYRRSHLPSLQLNYSPIAAAALDLGVSYEWKKSWEFAIGEGGAIERRERETFRRTAINIGMNYSPAPRTSITFSYLRRVQKSNVFADDITNQYIVNVRRLFR